jgi:hypothetical protein
MKNKNLYALAILLCLSSVALPNERAAWCGTKGAKACTATATGAATAAAPATAPGPGKADKTAASEESTNGSENHMFLHTFIKLLYI